jgi:hypothetical protein
LDLMVYLHTCSQIRSQVITQIILLIRWSSSKDKTIQITFFLREGEGW